jgi:tetratricopeptide (TPR) repeat protein
MLDVKYSARRDNLIGRAYYADGNFEKSSEYFARALKIDPAARNSMHYLTKFGLRAAK